MSDEADIKLREQQKRDKAKERNRRYRERHPERLKAKREKIAEWNRAYQREWYKKNQDRLKKKQRVYYRANREEVLAYQKAYEARNRPHTAKRMAAWVKRKCEADPAYRTILRKRVLKSMKKRRAEDPAFRIVGNLRRRLRSYVAKKGDRMMALIGCTLDEFRDHLERQFEPWMNWSNYGNERGKWVVDHIVAVAKYDLTDPEQQRACFHFKNLRPLCHVENGLKGDS